MHFKAASNNTSPIRWLLSCGVIVFIASSPTPSFAADEEGWGGEVGLGGVRTGGNTSVQSINGTAKLTRDWEALHFYLAGTALTAQNQGAVYSEKYTVDFSLVYYLSERAYVYTQELYTKDRFSGYQHRISETVGAGYSLIKNDTHTLTVSLGGGLRQSKHTTTRVTKNEAIWSPAMEYNWNISPTSSFHQQIYALSGKENTVSHFNSDLNMQILGNLSAQLGFHATHTSKVPSPAIKKLDTESVVNMVYSF